MVRRRGVDPVELVAQRQQLELLQREVELPGVGNEVEKIRRRSHGPVEFFVGHD